MILITNAVQAQLQNIGSTYSTVNNTVTLICVADGHPLPNIGWLKDGEELRNNNKYFPSNDISMGSRYHGIMQVTSNLIIRDLQTTDSGTYMCQASSSGTPGDSLSYQLTVPQPPQPVDSSLTLNHTTSTTGILDHSNIIICTGFVAQEFHLSVPHPQSFRLV